MKRSKLSLRDVAARGVGPHRGDAIVEIRRRLADRGSRSSGDGRRRRPRRSSRRARAGRSAGGDWLRPMQPAASAAFRNRAGEDVVEETQGVRRTIVHAPCAAEQQGRRQCHRPLRRHYCRAPPCHALSRPVQNIPVSGGPVAVSNSLTKVDFCHRLSATLGRGLTAASQGQAHRTAFVHGRKRATNMTLSSAFRHVSPRTIR